MDVNNEKYQQEHWLNPRSYTDTIKCFIFNFLRTNEFALTRKVRSLAPYFMNQEEVDLGLELKALCGEMYEAISKGVENNRNFQEYLQHPNWPKAVAKAQELYNLMQENDEKYGFEEELKKKYGESREGIFC